MREIRTKGFISSKENIAYSERSICFTEVVAVIPFLLKSGITKDEGIRSFSLYKLFLPIFLYLISTRFLVQFYKL